ncbi:MAG TPA: hypothetical protein VMV75_10070 [Sulfuricella sp.]|nr:hypothetical protein [Sulfuricella sp.]
MMKSNLSQHILPNSSMMLGVCMTVISVIKVLRLHSEQHRIAEVFAFNALIFLISAMFSYFSIRNESKIHLSVAMERIADVSFMLGLVVMTVAGFLLTYEIV